MNNFSHSWHPTAAHQPKLRRYRSASLLYEAEENNRMEQPKQRFPESSSEIYRPGSRLKIVLKERSGAREIEIEGNREGLAALSAICSGLAKLTPEELSTPANHYHLDEHFWGTEQGSIPLVIWCHEEGWRDDAG
jgi:hypothetical protein